MRLGNGDGSFKTAISNTVGAYCYGGEAHDINGDNVLDLVMYYPAPGLVALSQTEQVATIARLDLLTQSAARKATSAIDATLRRIGAERGAIGSMQSRISTALSNLAQSRENFESAAGQIRDVDTAVESSLMLRSRILQQAGAAVLAQAQQAPALALKLLRS